MSSQDTASTGVSPTRHVGWKVWENPIFRRYCRSRLRPHGLGVAILITVLIAGFLFGMSRSVGLNRSHLEMADAERAAIIPLLIFQGVILFILGTAQVSGGMTTEKDEGVIDYQRLIPMTPLAKALGYLFGLPVREYVMFAVTLPFTAWAMWRGGVSPSVWLPLYGVFLTSALTYHLTGLVTGTIVKNRRWAFLISIGLVFCLYTVVPQAAKFGLVFFKYLSITPVLEESLPGILPKTAGALVKTGQAMMPNVKFFDLSFPEAVFTVFCQTGLIIVFLVAICRGWRRVESLLLGKLMATGFFVWIQILLLGNALPLMDSGRLFPSREFSRRILRPDWLPQPEEALVMSGLYGLATLILLVIMATVITPSAELQIRGWRRARKHGSSSLPLLSDAATSAGWVLLMALIGAAGWFIFTRALVESRWFPGHTVPTSVFWLFTGVMVSAGVAFQSLLEAKGTRTVLLCVILIGVAPIMVGAVLGATSDRLIPAACWLFGISPASGPVYAAASQLSLSELPPDLARSVPRAFYFWQGVYFLTAIWLLLRLRGARKAIAGSAMVHETPPQPPV